MTFSYCVFASIRFDYFCENLAALLALRVSIGFPMGLFWRPWRLYWSILRRSWGHSASKIAPRLHEGVLWSHFGATLVCFFDVF